MNNYGQNMMENENTFKATACQKVVVIVIGSSLLHPQSPKRTSIVMQCPRVRLSLIIERLVILMLPQHQPPFPINGALNDPVPQTLCIPRDIVPQRIVARFDIFIDEIHAEPTTRRRLRHTAHALPTHKGRVRLRVRHHLGRIHNHHAQLCGVLVLVGIASPLGAKEKEHSILIEGVLMHKLGAARDILHKRHNL